MTPLPIFLLCGNAGVGKDTTAQSMVRAFKTRSIHQNIDHGIKVMVTAQADDIKFLAQDIFDFSTAQLWGPSENRNAPDTRYQDPLQFEAAYYRLLKTKTNVCHRLFGEDIVSGSRLETWFYDTRHHAKSTGALTPRHVLQTLGTEWGRSIDPGVWVNAALARAEQAIDRGDAGAVIITDGRFRNEILAVKRRGGVVLKIEREGTQVGTHQSEAELGTVPSWFFDDEIHNNGSIKALDTTVDSIVDSFCRGKL